MIDVDIIRSMVDFGIVVLIWLVQTIIYPFFASADKPSFIRWHGKYMRQITFFVAPLMFLQTGLIILKAVAEPSLPQFMSLAGLVFVWVHTFLVAVPLHNLLATQGNQAQLTNRLVRINWYRTSVWTLIWLLGMSGLIG